MELTMTNSFGFCELNENEMMIVDGGWIGLEYADPLKAGAYAGKTIANTCLGLCAGPVGAAVMGIGTMLIQGAVDIANGDAKFVFDV